MYRRTKGYTVTCRLQALSFPTSFDRLSLTCNCQVRYNIFFETAILSLKWASFGVSLSKIRICGDKMETYNSGYDFTVIRSQKRVSSHRLTEKVRPPGDRVLCTKSISIYAQHVAIGLKSNVKWFKMQLLVVK